MAALVAVEPTRSHLSGKPDGFAWFRFDDGRSYHRRMERDEVAASSFPSPSIRRDSIDPCRGMDGRMYDSLAGLRRTYEPSGNPQGERYIELGNDEPPKFTAPTFNRKQRRDDIRAGIEDVKNGRVPPLTVLED